MAHGASEVLDAVVVPLTLETLPPPVRHLILSQLKLPELSSLVHASPVFHAQYRESRRSLLAAALQSALHGVAVDAWAAHRSASMPLVESFAARRAAVVSYLDSYQQRRGDISKPFSLVVEAALTEEDATSMTFFYRRIVLPVMERKASLALSWLAKRSGLEPSITPLSATEEVRLLRGFYRFQLACNLFGRGRYLGKTATARGHDFRSVEILHIFLDLYEPWEVEEIACIYDFARDAVRNVFEEIAPAILSESAMADDGRPATPEGACHIESPNDTSPVTNPSLLVGTISRGLDLLYKAHPETTSLEDLVPTIKPQIAWAAGHFLEEALDGRALFRRRRRWPSRRDAMERRRDPMPFRGDRETVVDAQGLLYPPMAWVALWGGTYSNVFGDNLPAALRLWAYVMWDATRLDPVAGDVLVQVQKEMHLGDEDARDWYAEEEEADDKDSDDLDADE